MHTSAESLDFLELAKNCSFLNWKLASAGFHLWMSTNYGCGMSTSLIIYRNDEGLPPVTSEKTSSQVLELTGMQAV
jgi:hypothetical protein